MADFTKYARNSKRVQEIMQPGKSGFAKLIAHAREIERLDRKLKQFLEPGLASSVRVATLREHCLILLTPSAAVATRLRLDTGQILKTLNASGEKAIREIRVRIAPSSPEPEYRPRNRELPEIARRSLERFATDSGDSEIKAIISRKSTRITGE